MMKKKEEIEELLRIDMKVEEVIEKLEEKHEEKLLFLLKEKRQGEHWKELEHPNIQKKHTIQVWRRMNIKKQMWKSVMLLQMDGFIIEARRATKLKNPAEKICRWCMERVATVQHIVC